MQLARSLRNRIDLTGVVLLGFFLSGAASLMYEVVWVRMLGLIFGHTVHAITTVLVVFMGGLALGSYVCSRRIDRVRHLLRTYAWLEIGIGAYALLTPGLIDTIRIVYLSYARRFEPSFDVLTLIQFGLSTAVLLVPTSLMGATFPVLSRFVVQDVGTVGQRVGALYAWNTFGAVAGTYLVGFHLLPALGMRMTLVSTALVNLAVGGGVLLAACTWGDAILVRGPEQDDRLVATARAEGPTFARVLMLGAALSGAVAMIYELAWTRALTLVIGSTTYAFSAMLLSFLIGIAAGSAWGARRASRVPATAGLFAALQIAAALLSLVVLALFDRLPDVFLLGFSISRAPEFIVALQIVLSIAVMILPTFCLGAALPCAIHLLCRQLSSVGLSVGRVYAYNTTGAIAGAFAAGFLLIPWLGVQTTLRAAILVNLLIGLGVVFTLGLRLRWATWAATLGGVAVVLLPSWDLAVMSSGVSTYADFYARGGWQWRQGIQEQVLFYRDGIGATVSVHQGKDERSLRINGKADASTGADMATQVMLGHLPALLHPEPKTALVIGLGSGVTVGALIQYELDRIDVVEIEPAVAHAASFFASESRHALADPRVKLVVADGRNFLDTTSARYDLIVSEPSNPWIGGIATLFTVEFFEQARARLAEDGVMAQWVHGYAMAPEDLQMVAATFRAVFPQASLWSPVAGDFILIGTSHPQVVHLERVRDLYTRYAGIRQDFELSELTSPEAILRAFVLDDPDLANLAAGALLNTDDKLPLEFSAPRNLYRDTMTLNDSLVQRFKRSRFPLLSRQ
jgi:spermidine synthase